MSSELVPQLADFLRSVPYELTGQWYHKQSLVMDGFSFTQCRFDECTLYVSRGIFRMRSCFMSGCFIIYSNEARNVARLFSGSHVPNSVYVNPSLRPTANPDGTFSIDPAVI